MYHSELEGIKVMLEVVNKTATTDGTKQFVDNKQADNSANQDIYNPQQIMAPESDIILACHKLQRKASPPPI